MRRRLDAELVRRGLARSREQAVELVQAGQVLVGGLPAAKAATKVEESAALHVRRAADGPDYVSRGGHKLAGALDAFGPLGLTVAGRHCLDAGASTGGFSDVLLRAGAAHVVAVDVGYGQLAWSLRTDSRVTVLERTNVRDLGPGWIDPPPQLIVADLSFIAAAIVVAGLVRLAAPDGDLVVLVKPQFEVGRERVGRGGVVRDPDLRGAAVQVVADRAWPAGFGVRGVVASPLPGPAGNVEYFLWLQHGAAPLNAADVRRAVAEGPV